MIVINDKGFPTKESFDELIKGFYDNIYKPEHREYVEIYKTFLNECFIADQKLQEDVSQYLSPEFICFSILPINDTEDLTSFSFELAVMDEEREDISKKEELIFFNLCKKHFGNIKPLIIRALDYFEKP